MYTNVHQATPQQINALYERHFKPFLKKRLFRCDIMVSRIIHTEIYSYDEKDQLGFVIMKTMTGKTLECRMRGYTIHGARTCYYSITGFGNVRYDILNLENYPEFQRLIEHEALKAEKKFWEI